MWAKQLEASPQHIFLKFSTDILAPIITILINQLHLTKDYLGLIFQKLQTCAQFLKKMNFTSAKTIVQFPYYQM